MKCNYIVSKILCYVAKFFVKFFVIGEIVYKYQTYLIYRCLPKSRNLLFTLNKLNRIPSVIYVFYVSHKESLTSVTLRYM